NGVARQARFLCDDAEKVEIPPHSLDVVWCIECSEHLFDKPRFFQRAASWLKPGGCIALCAWLAGDALPGAAVQDVYDVCEGFFCPSLGTTGEYTGWMNQAGLTVERCHDWTSRVDRTWELCRDRVRRTRMRWL